MSPLSIAGLIAVVLVIAGGHIAVARYNLLATSLVSCVFSEDEDRAAPSRPDSARPRRLPHRPGVGIEEPQPTDTPEPSRPSRAA